MFYSVQVFYDTSITREIWYQNALTDYQTYLYEILVPVTWTDRVSYEPIVIDSNFQPF